RGANRRMVPWYRGPARSVKNSTRASAPEAEGALEGDRRGDGVAVLVARRAPRGARAEHLHADLAEAEALGVLTAEPDVLGAAVGADGERDERRAAHPARARLLGEVPVEVGVVRGARGRGA